MQRSNMVYLLHPSPAGHTNEIELIDKHTTPSRWNVYSMVFEFEQQERLKLSTVIYYEVHAPHLPPPIRAHL